MHCVLRRLLPSRLAARLMLLVCFTAALSAAIAATSMLIMGWQAAEAKALRDAREDVRSMAFSLAAPLAFEDQEGAQEVLKLISHREDVLAIRVLHSSGRLLHWQGAAVAIDSLRDGGGLRRGEIVVTEPVRASRGDDVLGSVTLRIDLGAARAELKKQAVAAGVALLVALALTLLLSQKMARRISVPVVRLAESAAALTRDWSRPRRLDVTGPGEIGVAIDAYNHMVDELAQRDAALQKLNDELRDSASAAQAARRQAESASVAKTRFLANMSHELRSPLNGVIGAAQLLEKSGHDPAFRQELVRIIQASGTNLLDLIDGVLDVSRIEAGRMQTENRPFDLLACVEAALAPAAASAAVKALALECHIDADVPGWCHGDASRLKQLLQNLLGNAVKFSDSGSVTLEVHRGAGNVLDFCVADTGVGIPAHMLEKIFQPFQQADASATRRFGGSGLGLTICRELARLMGGDVGVESTPGAGSRFTLRLPLPAVAHADAGAKVLPRQVYCYEPLLHRRRALAALLQRLGCEAGFCDDLPAVRAALAQPVPAGSPRPWLVAADAAGSSAVMEALRAAGAGCALLGNPAGTAAGAAVLSRPVTGSALRAWLAGKSGMVDVATAKHDPGSAMTAQVLLVEDDPVNRLVVRSMIEGRGIQCVAAINGTEALRCLGQQHFDAVLMDWQMPDMDGLEVTRHLRAGACGELNRAVPVIALTANAFAEDRNACLAAGMNDFLSKPVQAETLLQCVQRWCRGGGSQATGATAGQPARREDPPAAVAYDPAILAPLNEADGSADCVQELLALFCASVRSALPEMAAQLAAGDWENLRRTAHTLKGGAGQVGAMAFSRHAAALESGLREGRCASETDIAGLHEAFARFMAAAGLAEEAMSPPSVLRQNALT
ncbi:MAG TPA: ATP-binding protein [Steroidobacteraceae bacterium]|nr:ATP-binding protein [Steroidobacteraceae bacterium]